MYLLKKLKQLEEMGIDSPYHLSELLINGTLPNGKTISEQQRKEYISITCGVLYETATDIKHIQNYINS